MTGCWFKRQALNFLRQ